MSAELEIEVEVEVPQVEVEIDVEPVIEVEVDVEPVVEVEVDMELDTNVQQPIVEVELEVGGSGDRQTPKERFQCWYVTSIILFSLTLTALLAGLFVCIFASFGVTVKFWPYWFLLVVLPGVFFLFFAACMVKMCREKKQMGGYSDLEVQGEVGGNQDVNVEVNVEMPTLALKMDEPQVVVEEDMNTMDFSIEVEIDMGFDINVWGAKKTSRVGWTGYYVQNGARNDMLLDNMDIAYDGTITGDGSDVNGGFTIEGNMDNSGKFTFNKNYDGYTVVYAGNQAGNSLKGTWFLGEQTPEEFSITLKSPAYTGWFEQGGNKNNMDLDMYVDGDTVFGTGSDSVGCFVIRGVYNAGSGECNFCKQYLGAHQVFYFGNAKKGGQVIRGKWTIPDNCDGKFKIKVK